jgi:hypothetical protein
VSFFRKEDQFHDHKKAGMRLFFRKEDQLHEHAKAGTRFSLERKPILLLSEGLWQSLIYYTGIKLLVYYDSPPAWGLGKELTTPHLKKQVVAKCYIGPRTCGLL